MIRNECPKCGACYITGANYCSHCGEKLPKYDPEELVSCPFCDGTGKIKRKYTQLEPCGVLPIATLNYKGNNSEKL